MLVVAFVQLLSHVRLFVTPWTAAHQDSMSFTISQNLLKLMSIESMMTSNHLIFCHPFLLLHSIFHRNRAFSNESAFHIRWPKYWSFSISNSSEYSGLRIYVKMAPETYSTRALFLCSRVISASRQVTRDGDCALQKCARTSLTVQ